MRATTPSNLYPRYITMTIASCVPSSTHCPPTPHYCSPVLQTVLCVCGVYTASRQKAVCQWRRWEVVYQWSLLLRSRPINLESTTSSLQSKVSTTTIPTSSPSIPTLVLYTYSRVTYSSTFFVVCQGCWDLLMWCCTDYNNFVSIAVDGHLTVVTVGDDNALTVTHLTLTTTPHLSMSLHTQSTHSTAHSSSITGEDIPSLYTLLSYASFPVTLL